MSKVLFVIFSLGIAGGIITILGGLNYHDDSVASSIVSIGVEAIIISGLGVLICKIFDNIEEINTDFDQSLKRIDDNLYELTMIMEKAFPEAYKEYAKEEKKNNH